MSDPAIESGVVTKVIGDKALVKLTQTESCKSCAARILCRPGKDGTSEITAYNYVNAGVGDTVEITETDNLLLKLSLMQFGIPLLGLIIGILVIYFSDITFLSIQKEILSALGGFVGLLLGGFFTWIWSNKVAANIACVFQIFTVKMTSR